MTPLFIALLAGQLFAEPPAAAPHKRCGWIWNPTPANWYLRDKDGDWWISVQGGAQARGFDDVDFKFAKKQWVVTNGASYGYGCGCATVEVDVETKTVRSIGAARALPRTRCRQDKKLPKP